MGGFGHPTMGPSQLTSYQGKYNMHLSIKWIYLGNKVLVAMSHIIKSVRKVMPLLVS